MRQRIVKIIILLNFVLLGCSTNIDFDQLDSKMDQWHVDVATFKLEAYFGFMHESFIFLGTAPGERWNKTEFRNFSAPYFEKESTWDFKSFARNWYLSDDGKVAWFEEDLNTWMADCRGSGVLIKTNGNWQIAHYNLTVLIENEKIQEFISLRKSDDNNLSSPEK